MAARLQTVRILWMALVVSSLLFLLIITSHLAHSPDPMPPHLPEMLGALAFGIAILSIVLPARGLDMGLRSLDVTIENDVGEPIGSFREAAPVERFIAKPHDAVIRA